MFCSQCGKKVLNTMTFCPFCGTKIVVPEGDEIQEEPLSAAEFEPLNLEELQEKAPTEPEAPKRAEGKPRYEPYPAHPAQLNGHAPELRHDESRQKHSDTFVPVRAVEPQNLFMDDEEEKESGGDEFVFEEREPEGFFVKHIRSLVALALCAVMALALTVWIFTTSGQLALAGMNLAWKPEVYAQLGNQYFQKSNYAAATECYERALNRDEENYAYAYSAGVCSYMAKDNEKATEMAKLAAKLDPLNNDPYELLQRIYPDAATRPWEVQSLFNAHEQALREAQS